MALDRPKVVILGGGMAGLVSAWELSRGEWRDTYESITLYQRGWRLGGKGASSRGVNQRIEEHGLHVLLGYYHETFRTMREIYDELDRASTNPECPIQTWSDAVEPAGAVGLTDRTDDGWAPWVTEFSPTSGVPGSRPRPSGQPLDLLAVTIRSLRLLADFQRSLGEDDEDAGGITLSGSPVPPPRGAGLEPLSLLRAAGLTAVAAALEMARQMEQAATMLTERVRLTGAIHDALRASRIALESRVMADAGARRTWGLVDLVVTNLRGIVADRLLTRPEGAAAINHLDYRKWLRRHGASDEAVDSAIVRGMYDLVFAYEGGDRSRPAFSAGLGLELASRMLFDHEGAIFWKMQAGMGEIIFAPMYEGLKRRGVEFRFFHRVDEVHLDDAQEAIAAIDIGIQATVAAGAGAYEPLIPVGGLSCWPHKPLLDQLVASDGVAGAPLESLWCQAEDAGSLRLVSGEDFDTVVFAISLGMVPHVASQLVEASPNWRDMVQRLATVDTQAFQLWLNEDERDLGWQGPTGVTLSGFADAFDTWASMTHLIDREAWSPDAMPRSLAYFCAAMEPGGDPSDPATAERAHTAVRQAAVSFLNNDVKALWPDAAGEDGFRWDLLSGGAGDGEARFDGQYWRANIDPSDRYVQSLPGSDSYRLPPGDTGFRNLVIAGDWTDCGLNAGCIEAATLSGQLAAEAVAEQADDERRDAQR